MRFYYCAASPFRLNPRIHPVEFTLPVVVRKKEQPLDGTLKEIGFHITKHMALPDTDPYNEENVLQTDNSKVETLLVVRERRLKEDQAHMPYYRAG